jgi:hypothetical protein
MATVGDLTSAVMSGSYDTSIPAIAAPALPPQTLSGSCSLVNQDTESGGAAPSVPTNQTMPNQEGGTARPAALALRPRRRLAPCSAPPGHGR